MNTTLWKIIPLLLLVGIALSACGPADSLEAKSDQTRVMAPQVPVDTMHALVEGNNLFAIDLYHALRTEGSNLLYSPYSISLALAMTYGGARGATESQMASTLHFDLPQETLHAAFNQLDLELAERSEVDEEGAQPIQLDIANAIWAQRDYAFLPEYLDLLALNYGAGIHQSDFNTRADETAEEINQWVSDRTHERIQDIISPGALGELTRLVLVNAIYFKADWMIPFDVMDTQLAPFNLLDGTEIQVDMMAKYFELPYYAGSLSGGIGYQAVRLPYADNMVVMEIIVPDRGQFEAFEAALDWQTLEAILGGMHRMDVHLKMPKFTFRSAFALAGPLQAMGMPDAFDPNLADFSSMDGTRNLNIDSVIHQAFVAVDETGTEAAAATVVEIVEVSMQIPEPEIIELTIDRPFIFLIRDLSSGQILFAGRVLNPAQ
jgi:serpin B